MKKSSAAKHSATDWARIDAMTDNDIDLSDLHEVTPEMFARGVIRHNLKPVSRKELLTLRVDQDVLAWFKAQGRGYQTRINELLRAYMEANQQHRRKKSTSLRAKQPGR